MGRLAGVAVDGGRSHQNGGGVLGLVAGPGVVEAEVGREVPGQDRAVQGADLADLQPGGLLEQGLHLRAVLAHNVQEVPAGIVDPVGEAVALGHHPEPAEAVGREEHLLLFLIADHDLGPVDHGGKDKVQGVAAQAEGVAVLDGDPPAGRNGPGEEVFQIGKGLGVAHHLHVRVTGSQTGHAARMVGLNVGDDQIIGRLAGQFGLEGFHPGVAGAGVGRVHDGGLFVPDQIAVVADPAGNGVLALEQIDLGIVDADAQNGIAHAGFIYIHRRQSFLFRGLPGRRRDISYHIRREKAMDFSFTAPARRRPAGWPGAAGRGRRPVPAGRRRSTRPGTAPPAACG